MSKARDLADLMSSGSILEDGVLNTTEIVNVTATADELNKLDGVTATTAELNKLAGTTATTSDFDKMSNVTASATELNYMTGATSSVQDQLDNISVTSGSLTKSFLSGESSTITLSSSVSPTAVVAVTKEVSQTGTSSKGAWDVNATASNYELYNEAPATSLTIEGWDVSNASYLQGFDVSSQDGGPTDVFFKPDGTKMYVTGSLIEAVNEYDLSTAWDVSTASYLQNFSVSSQETGPTSVFFKSDGTKMYVIGDNSDNVNEYDLSTAWDISTASYLQNFSVSSQESVPKSLFFKPDGTKFYIVGRGGQDVNEYNLSTAWDVTTASYLQNFSVASQETFPRGLFFKPDGTKMYVAGNQGDDVNEYNLSTAWDISTATYNQNFSVFSQDAIVEGLFFKPDGSKMYVLGSSNDNVNEYDVSLIATLGTGSFSSSDVGKRIFVDDGGEAILINTDGTTSLVTDFGSTSYTSGNWSLSGLDADADNGITLSELSQGFDLSSATYSSNSISISAQGGNPQAVFFKPDGTKMYVVGYSSDDVDEYDLSTAWDVSTAIHRRGFFVAALETSPRALFFKPDGTKMYVLGQQGDDVNEFNLSTAWNVTTASLFQTNSIASEESTPYGIYFRNDGLKMYVCGQSGEDVNEYNLSTAWDISTLAFVNNKSVTSQTSSPQSVSFSEDGTKMFILGQTEDAVFEYDLSTAWDVTTAVYSKTFSVASQATYPTGMFFKPNGTELYVVDQGNDSVYQYNVGSVYQPTAQYLPAVTNASGQIDSTYWTDINSMTADDTDGDGQVYYAVSTDDRTTWSIAKTSDGVRDIVRNNGGTWQYNTAVGGWGLSGATFNQSFDFSAQETNPVSVFFKTDGTKMYVMGTVGDDVNEYTLSTAWDVSTATYNQAFSVATQELSPYGLFFKPDGTKMYITGDDVSEYDLSTAWDVSTASFNQSFSVTSQDTTPTGLFFKSDGLKMYVIGYSGLDVNEYNLSTAWNISTATYSQNFSISSAGTEPFGLFFKSDGTKMYVCGSQYDDVNEYRLSTAWDISTASYSQTLSVTSQDANPRGIFFKPDGTKMYIAGSSSDQVYEYDTLAYSTSTTWTNSTTNSELAALAQAMTVVVNQMDKAQIDAVTDGSHFTLGNTLDLAAILYLGSTGTSPTTDGVSINYDAAALNQGAVLGTDYDYDFPANNKVRITSNATQNLKIRVV